MCFKIHLRIKQTLNLFEKKTNSRPNSNLENWLPSKHEEHNHGFELRYATAIAIAVAISWFLEFPKSYRDHNCSRIYL